MTNLLDGLESDMCGFGGMKVGQRFEKHRTMRIEVFGIFKQVKPC